MYSVGSALSDARNHPSRYLVIHYSSQSLFDEVEGGFSPRITSIVVMFFQSRQTVNFSLHSIAEELKVNRENVEEKYDEIERKLLERFYGFAKDHFDKCWLHWNMRNTIFGFKHLEHRYRVLCQNNPPTIPFDNRVNISDILKYHFGSDYAPDPRMLKLMEMNGRRDPRFMTGDEESRAFGAKQFIRMNSSTISKVEFFRHVVNAASRGKLKTAGKTLRVRIDRMLDSSGARIVAFVGALIGIPSGIFAIIQFF